MRRRRLERRSGAMRHVLTYQVRATSLDSLGQPVESWEDRVTGVRARIDTAPMQEMPEAREQMTSHSLITRRPAAGVDYDQSGRFVEPATGRVYNVVSATPSNDGLTYYIMCMRSLTESAT